VRASVVNHGGDLCHREPLASGVKSAWSAWSRSRRENIHVDHQGVRHEALSAGLLRPHVHYLVGRLIAKDGADLPPDAVRSSKAQLTITVGETYDVEFSTATAQDLLLDLLLPAQKIHTSQTLFFAPASSGAQ
jgi:hypothetical protein